MTISWRFDCRPTSWRTCRRRRATGPPAPLRPATTPTRRRKRKKTSTTTTTSPSQMVRTSCRQWRCENTILKKNKKKTQLYLFCPVFVPLACLLLRSLFLLTHYSHFPPFSVFLLLFFVFCDLCPHSRCPHSIHCLIWPGR